MSNYLSNKDFLRELNYYNQNKIITKRLHEMFYLLSKRISQKSYMFYKMINQPVKSENLNENMEDFIHDGYLKCLKRINKFDMNCDNPFAYFTSVIINTYKDYFFNENRHFILKKIAQNNFEHRFLMKWGVPLKKEYDEE